jgi:hypothetical protein
MTAPTGWWCPTCGHTQAAPVADQPDPEPPTGVERTDDGWVLLPHRTLYDTGWEIQTPSGHWCRIGERYSAASRAVPVRPVGVPVGDDTPTADLGALVDEVDAWCDECGDPSVAREWAAKDLLYRLVALVWPPHENRAEAAPDLTALPDAEQAYDRAIDDGAETCSHFRLGVEDVVDAVAALVRENTVGVPVGDDTPVADQPDPDLTALPDAGQVLAYLHEQHISLMWVIKEHSTKAAIDRVLDAVAALAREDTDDG